MLVSDLKIGDVGEVISFISEDGSLSDRLDILKRRFLEIGILEGVRIKVLHFGLWGKDPIAIQIGDSGTVFAIRRDEAKIVKVKVV